MVRIEAGWRPFQGLALEFDLRSKDGLPSIGLVDDSIPDLFEDSRLRMPNARMDAAFPGLQVEKVARRHMLRRSCLVVPEVDPDMGLVRALVRREPNVPVNPRDGSTERAGVPDDVGTDFFQPGPPRRGRNARTARARPPETEPCSHRTIPCGCFSPDPGRNRRTPA